MDTPIPSAEQSTQLIELVPRIAKIETLQASQNIEISELRQRSVAVLQRWYTLNVLGVGEQLAEVEGRVEGLEQKLRRVALSRRADEHNI